VKVRVQAVGVGPPGVIVGAVVRVLLGAVVALGPPGVWVGGVVGVLAGVVGEAAGGDVGELAGGEVGEAGGEVGTTVGVVPVQPAGGL
jgi:hypothetical protein